MIDAIRTGIYEYSAWSVSKIKDVVNEWTAKEFFANKYLLLHGGASFSEEAYTYCKNLSDCSVKQLSAPNKEEIWKLFGVPEEKVITYSKDGATFQFTIQILSSYLNENCPTHTCLRFGGAKEDKDIIMAQGMSLMSGYADFTLVHDEASHYNFTLIQANFYETYIKKADEGEFRQWKPDSAEGFGDLSYIIEGLHEDGIKIDSLYFYSLGTTVFYGLKDPSIAEKLSGTTLVIDRGFTRSDSVAMKMFHYPVAMLFRGISYGLGWAVNTEEAMIKALEQIDPSNKPRVIIVEVEDDHYFSGTTAFNSNLCRDLSPHATSVDRIKLRSEPVNEEIRAFFDSNLTAHGLPTDYLYPMERHQGIKMANDTIHFKPDENLAQFMARSVFNRIREH